MSSWSGCLKLQLPMFSIFLVFLSTCLLFLSLSFSVSLPVCLFSTLFLYALILSLFNSYLPFSPSSWHSYNLPNPPPPPSFIRFTELARQRVREKNMTAYWGMYVLLIIRWRKLFSIPKLNVINPWFVKPKKNKIYLLLELNDEDHCSASF